MPEGACSMSVVSLDELIAGLRLAGQVDRLERSAVLDPDVFFRVVASTIGSMPDGVASSPVDSGDAVDRRSGIRMLVALPGLNALTPEDAVCQVGGVLGWDVESTWALMSPWANEAGVSTLQEIGRLRFAGVTQRECAVRLGVSETLVKKVSQFVGVAQTKARQDLLLAVELVRDGAGWSKLAGATGWSATKAVRFAQLAADVVRAEDEAAKLEGAL